MNSPVAGDKTKTMFAQLVCAKLNVLIGNDDSCISDAIEATDAWLTRYPVGSGMIERAVALVINRRMKKRGMRWCRHNATAVVALRTAVLNDDWLLPQRLRAFP